MDLTPSGRSADGNTSVFELCGPRLFAVCLQTKLYLSAGETIDDNDYEQGAGRSTDRR